VNKGPKILVVDDQLGMRLSLKTVLSKKGYDVSMADDGNQALEAVRKSRFKVIFMDIKMPGMSGVETFIKIKEIDPHITVIMMTGYAVEDEIKRAIREGAYTVVYKPFEMGHILKVVEDCLDGRTLILVIEEGSDLRVKLQPFFVNKGFKVTVVNTGEECVKCVQEKKFQIIILNTQLPGIDGLETLRRVKTIRPDVGVIMITAESEEHLIHKAMEHGSSACIRKPYNIEDLLNLVHECLL